jgi:hypothetical protein
LKILDEVETVGGGTVAAGFGGELGSRFFELFVKERGVLLEDLGV